MSKRRAPSREPGKPSTSASGGERRSRFRAALIVLVCLGIAAVVVERLTRPADRPSSSNEPLPLGETTEARDIPPPPRAVPSYTETVGEAKQLGRQIAEDFPDDAAALALAGTVQYSFGDPDRAEADWQRAIELEPRSAEAWLGLAKTAHKSGEFEQAVQRMQRLAEVAPDQAESQIFFLVDSLLKLGRPQEVIDRLGPLGQSARLPGGARVALGQAYYQLQRYEQSADQYRRALDDPQYRGVARYGLSSALMRLGQPDEAQRYRQEYARLQVQDMAISDRMQRAGTDEERDDPSALYPILAGFHFEAAKLYAIHAQQERAVEHALRAWALTPERPEPKLLVESLLR